MFFVVYFVFELAAFNDIACLNTSVPQIAMLYTGGTTTSAMFRYMYALRFGSRPTLLENLLDRSSTLRFYSTSGIRLKFYKCYFIALEVYD